MKTSELTGPALDWAVAKCDGHDPLQYETSEGAWHTGNWLPSIDWEQGGPIIERELLLLRPYGLSWECSMGGINWLKGPTPLIAAMRCYVASRLGDTVDIPKELLGVTD